MRPARRRPARAVALDFRLAPEQRLLKVGVQGQEVPSHREFRASPVVAANGLHYALVLFVGDAQAFGVAHMGAGLSPGGGQPDAVNHVEGHQQQTVARRLCDLAMKRAVQLLHLLWRRRECEIPSQGVEPVHQFRRSLGGGEAREAGLNLEARLHDLQRAHLLGEGGGDRLGKRRLRADESSLALMAPDPVLRSQLGQRRPHEAATDAKLLRKPALARQAPFAAMGVGVHEAPDLCDSGPELQRAVRGQ